MTRDLTRRVLDVSLEKSCFFDRRTEYNYTEMLPVSRCIRPYTTDKTCQRLVSSVTTIKKKHRCPRVPSLAFEIFIRKNRLEKKFVVEIGVFSSFEYRMHVVLSRSCCQKLESFLRKVPGTITSDDPQLPVEQDLTSAVHTFL